MADDLSPEMQSWIESDRLRTREHRVANLRMELPDEGISLEDVERELLRAALEKHDWNQTRGPRFSTITRSTLCRGRDDGTRRSSRDGVSARPIVELRAWA